jgi:predicted O-methyltransferase YrrM
MNEEQWSSVDNYLVALLAPSDEALTSALADSEAAGLPPIAVAPNQGKMLELLARATGASK